MSYVQQYGAVIILCTSVHGLDPKVTFNYYILNGKASYYEMLRRTLDFKGNTFVVKFCYEG